MVTVGRPLDSGGAGDQEGLPCLICRVWNQHRPYALTVHQVFIALKVGLPVNLFTLSPRGFSALDTDDDGPVLVSPDSTPIDNGSGLPEALVWQPSQL